MTVDRGRNGGLEKAGAGGARLWLIYGGGAAACTAVVVTMVVAVSLIVTSTIIGSVSPGCESGEASSGAGLGSGVGAAAAGSGEGEWLATAYGPPWAEGNGSGVTATDIDLRPAKHAYIVAVDPSVIPLGSYVHVWPNPFNNKNIAFQAADTGGAILGKHVDVYDWRGRRYQDDWGERKVSVTPAPSSGAGSLLGLTEAGSTPVGCETSETGPVPLTPGQSAKILGDGSAAAPTGIPGRAGAIVKAIIAAGNEIDAKPYPEPDVHYGPLSAAWPAYDCSGSTSYVLFEAGLHSVNAEDSGELEKWGESGPGKYLTIYANSKHVFVSVAGIALNTADYVTPNPAGSGPRWQPGSTVEAQLNGDPEGFTARHWRGM